MMEPTDLNQIHVTGAALMEQTSLRVFPASWQNRAGTLLIWQIPDFGPYSRNKARLFLSRLQQDSRLQAVAMEPLSDGSGYEIQAFAPVLCRTDNLQEPQIRQVLSQMDQLHEEGLRYGSIRESSIWQQEDGSAFLLPSLETEPSPDVQSDYVQLASFLEGRSSLSASMLAGLKQTGTLEETEAEPPKISLSAADLKEEDLPLPDPDVDTPDQEEEDPESAVHSLFSSAFDAIVSMDPNHEIPKSGEEKSGLDLSGLKESLKEKSESIRSSYQDKKQEKKAQEDARPVQLEKVVVTRESAPKQKTKVRKKKVRRKRRRFFTFGRIFRLALLCVLAFVLWQGYGLAKSYLGDISRLDFTSILQTIQEKLSGSLPDLSGSLEDLQNSLPDLSGSSEQESDTDDFSCPAGSWYDPYSGQCQILQEDSGQEETDPDDSSYTDPSDECWNNGGTWNGLGCEYPNE